MGRQGKSVGLQKAALRRPAELYEDGQIPPGDDLKGEGGDLDGLKQSTARTGKKKRKSQKISEYCFTFKGSTSDIAR